MADEEVENLPPEDGGGKKGKSPLVPIILVVVLVPGLTFAITQFLVVPKIKHIVADAVASANAEHKDPDQSEGHAKNDPGKELQSYEFEDIVANLSGALHSRYVKVSFTVEGTDPQFVEQIELNKAKLIDTTLGTLSSLTIMDLEQPGVKNMLRNDLLKAFELALNKELIEQLYFSEFVVQ